MEASLRRGSATSTRSSRYHLGIRDAAWSPVSTRLALAAQVEPIRVLNTRTLEVMGQASDQVRDSEFVRSPDGGTLISIAQSDSHLRIYNGFDRGGTDAAPMCVSPGSPLVEPGRRPGRLGP